MHISAKLILLSVIGFFLLTICIYYPSLSGGFYHDDRPNLVHNNKVQIETLSIETIKQAATSSSAGTLKRPISMVSFALNYYFFGDDPFSFKLTNVILHFLTSLLVFLVTFQLHKIVRKDQSNNSSFCFAAVVTVIWLVHPLHVSTVAYAVQRMAILSTFFSLLAIYFYIVGRTKILNNVLAGSSLFSLCVLSFILGIYSKENAALTIVLILFIEAVIFYPQTNSVNYKKLSLYSTLVAAIVAVISLILFYSQIHHFISEWYYSTREFTLSDRLYTQSRIIIYYIKWLAFPNIQELGLFHDDIPLSTSLFSPITTLFSIIAIGLFILIAVIVRKKHPIITLGIGWFFIGHLLESTIIPLEMIYEHRNYLPSVGLIIFVTYLAFSAIASMEKLKQGSYFLLFVTVAVFSTITYVRSSQWSDPINFAYFEALHHPNSLRAAHVLGLEYKGMAERGYTEYSEDAFKYLEQASMLGDKRLYSEMALIQLAHELDKPAKPVWIDRMANKLSIPVLRIDDLLILKELTLCPENYCLLPKNAALILLDATNSNPRLSLDKRNHALYNSIKANFILQRGGSIKQAEVNFQNAIELYPIQIQYYVDYINFLLALNRPNDAAVYIKQAKENNRVYENIPLLEKLDKSIKYAMTN